MSRSLICELPVMTALMYWDQAPSTLFSFKDTGILDMSPRLNSQMIGRWVLRCMATFSDIELNLHWKTHLGRHTAFTPSAVICISQFLMSTDTAMINKSLLRGEILKSLQFFLITRTFLLNYMEVYGEFKGLGHPKIKMLSSFTPKLDYSLYYGTQNMNFTYNERQ